MKYITVTSLIFFINILRIQCLNEICFKNSNCNTINAICKDGKCVCDDISYYSESKGQCLDYVTEYKAYCQETDQCGWLGSNSVCSNNRCVCQTNYRWFRGQCRPFVDKGKACSSSLDCYNGYDMLSMKCSDNICTCNDDYYDRGSDCRKKSLEGDCALDFDCSQDANSELVCELGRCKKPSTSLFENTFTNELENVPITIRDISSSSDDGKISCSFNRDCIDMANSYCDASSGTCKCNKATHFLCEGNCLPGMKSCKESDCSNIGNSMCYKGSCICKAGYFLNGGKCIPELGMEDPTLKNVSDCVIKPGKLLDSACYCKTYWFNDETNRNCIKTTLQQTTSCLTNDWCDAMGPYSFCNSTTKKCQCTSFAELNEKTFYCEKVEKPSEGSCLRNSECPLNERCIDESCQCIENFSRKGENSVCLPDVGGSCDITGCQHIANSDCLQDVCQCYANYTGKNDECLKIADNLDDSCEENEQCQHFKYAECGPTTETNKTCMCQNGYTNINNDCMQLKDYGDPCMTKSECTLVLNDSFQCRKNKCQCQVGYKLENGYCVSKAATYSKPVLVLIFFIAGLRLT